MFNSPILDVAIGLIFIFLLYSLLATSINEAIATLFHLRARMLKNAIIESMLSNTPKYGRLKSMGYGIGAFMMAALRLFMNKEEKKEEDKNIGDYFYDHPIITSYGSSRVFPYTSYVSADNFSTILIDTLKQEFDKRVSEIAAYRMSLSSNSETLANTEQSLLHSSDIIKIKEIIEYYQRSYTLNHTAPANSVIESETSQILTMHLNNAAYDMNRFIKNLEGWYDDTMNRVSGWYKRQTQTILFIIGILLAVVFNIDTIEISNKLSTDKDARDKLVQLSIDAVDKFKDDPRVLKKEDKNGNIIFDNSDSAKKYNYDSIFKIYQAQSDSIRKFLENDIAKANNIIALGWGDYGMNINKGTVFKGYAKCSAKIDDTKTIVLSDSSSSKDSALFLAAIYDDHWIRYKIGHVLKEATRGKKFLGFLITAFAISLGAPFWFDLLSKLVKLRAAGKKEDSGGAGTVATGANSAQPVVLNVNTQTGEEAVG